MTSKGPYLLAIESAIAGGSIAVFRESEFVVGRSGSQTVSRAEDLLPNVHELLSSANVSKLDLGRIAVSLGPGSYTGLRIGIASVMGLARGLGIESVGVSIFEALAFNFPDVTAFAVPMGKTDICFSLASSTEQPSVTTLPDFLGDLEVEPGATIGIHTDLISSLDELGEINLVDLGRDLAQFIGTAALNLPATRNLEAIYVQNPRFG